MLSPLGAPPDPHSHSRPPQVDAPGAGTLSQAPTRLRVFHNCRNPGTTEIIATLPVADAIPLRWTWVKACVLASLDHVSVGTRQGLADVVADGEVSSAWNVSDPHFLQSALTPRIDLDVSSLESQAFLPLRLEARPPIAVATVTGHFDPHQEPSAPPDFPANEAVSYLAKNQHATLTVHIACTEPGPVVIEAQLVPYPYIDPCVEGGQGGAAGRAVARCAHRGRADSGAQPSLPACTAGTHRFASRGGTSAAAWHAATLSCRAAWCARA